MKNQCFIEVGLWEKFSIVNLFSAIKDRTMCIRYDENSWLCIIGRKCILKKVKKFYWYEKKEVDCKSYLVGKIYLEQLIGKEVEDPKDVLRKYIEIVSKVYK